MLTSNFSPACYHDCVEPGQESWFGLLDQEEPALQMRKTEAPHRKGPGGMVLPSHVPVEVWKLPKTSGYGPGSDCQSPGPWCRSQSRLATAVWAAGPAGPVWF